MTAHDAARFELIFVVEGISDAFDPKIELVEEHFDCIVESHSDLTLLTVTAPEHSAFAAAVLAVRVLESAGICVVRSYPDLVTRQDIADRADVTRQAVGNWVRGDRSGDHPFPIPVSLAAGGLWLWRDVNRWLAERGLGHDSTDKPTLETLAQLDAWLSSRSRPETSPFAEVAYIASSAQFARPEKPLVTAQFEPWVLVQ
ncbi:helix-turn-helix transcriptional regulator [Nocardia sp. R6R-6]|uniref:helix-turn-helix transcriptional regulator n=1 Tax=Nocardia sp. R6R-6 TaxID=3459303 RepID=UPI00403D7C9B